MDSPSVSIPLRFAQFLGVCSKSKFVYLSFSRDGFDNGEEMLSTSPVFMRYKL